MIVLGIHDGHNSGASLFMNGKLLSAISEEKYLEKKMNMDFLKNLLNLF